MENNYNTWADPKELRLLAGVLPTLCQARICGSLKSWLPCRILQKHRRTASWTSAATQRSQWAFIFPCPVWSGVFFFLFTLILLLAPLTVSDTWFCSPKVFWRPEGQLGSPQVGVRQLTPCSALPGLLDCPCTDSKLSPHFPCSWWSDMTTRPHKGLALSRIGAGLEDKAAQLPSK